MSKDRVVVTGNSGDGYRITWVFAENSEYGCSLGEWADDGTGDPPRDNIEREAWAACKAVLGLKPVRDNDSWFWQRRWEADAALRVARAALKEERSRQKRTTRESK